MGTGPQTSPTGCRYPPRLAHRIAKTRRPVRERRAFAAINLAIHRTVTRPRRTPRRLTPALCPDHR
jgi:hypothetical protein